MLGRLFNRQDALPVDDLPDDYTRVRRVADCADLAAAKFTNGENLLYARRALRGDFNALARDMAKIDHNDHVAYIKGVAIGDGKEPYRAAARQVLDDMDYIESLHGRPELRVIGPGGYTPSVMRMHFDSTFQRYMTCYTAPVTEFVRNDEVDIARSYREWRFTPREDANIYTLGLGDMWRHRGLAGFLDYLNPPSQAEVEGLFIHRAPRVSAFGVPRLVLVGESVRP